MNVKNLFFEDNRSSDTTMIFLQGGVRKHITTDLSLELATLTAQRYYYVKTIRFFKNRICKNINFVHVKQVQHFDQEINVANVLEARKLNEENIEILKKVVDFQKAKGKKLILMGHSFGAWVGQEYISKYGTKDFEKVILAHGRLFVPAFVSFAIRYLKSWTYYNENGVISAVDEFKDSKNAKLLFYDLMQNDYVKKLVNIDLTNVFYITSKGDNLLGNISKYELSFLKSKGAYVHTFKTRTAKIISKLTFNKVEMGRISHHMIFNPMYCAKIRKIISSEAKKLPFRYKKKIKSKQKHYKTRKDVRKILKTQTKREYYKRDDWKKMSEKMVPYIKALKIHKTQGHLNKNELEKNIKMMQELNSKRAYDFPEWK